MWDFISISKIDYYSSWFNLQLCPPCQIIAQVLEPNLILPLGFKSPQNADTPHLIWVPCFNIASMNPSTASSAQIRVWAGKA